ncbi:MAG: AraC family transcriptional regulator [Carboxylicivirga sp.]|jgi:AraC-like DNA-binding protein|nr:AraC family transcriptional regulator [Carboxylicivirga sp.]
MSTILNIGIVLSFFLAILLFSKKDKSLSDNILSIWLATIGIHLTGYYLHYNGYWELYPHLIGLTAPIPFLYGPFLYLYLVHSIQNSGKLRLKEYIHFAPVIISYLYMSPFFFLYTVEDKVRVDKGLIDDYSVFSSLLLIGFIISGLGYSIVSFRKLIIRKRLIKDNFSYQNRINLNWLRNSVIGIGFVFLTVTIVSILREVVGLEFTFNADILFYSIIVAFVFYIGYFGIRQKDLFSNSNVTGKDLINVESEYKKSGLKTGVAELKHQELLELMNNEKPYLNPKLTLNDLSKQVGMSSNNLSQLINQYEKVNFYDFVNKYRVEEFIKRAANNKEFNLLAHALDSGFNSKSSFNSVFKKLKEETPSHFLAKMKN